MSTTIIITMTTTVLTITLPVPRDPPVPGEPDMCCVVCHLLITKNLLTHFMVFDPVVDLCSSSFGSLFRDLFGRVRSVEETVPSPRSPVPSPGRLPVPVSTQVRVDTRLDLYSGVRSEMGGTRSQRGKHSISRNCFPGDYKTLRYCGDIRGV